MKRFENQIAEASELSALLEQCNGLYDDGVVPHATRTRFCAMECTGCAMRELEIAIDEILEDMKSRNRWLS